MQYSNKNNHDTDVSVNPLKISRFFSILKRYTTDRSFQELEKDFYTKYYDEVQVKFYKEEKYLIFMEQIDDDNNWIPRKVTLIDYCREKLQTVINNLKAQYIAFLTEIDTMKEANEYEKLFFEEIDEIEHTVKSVTNTEYRLLLQDNLESLKARSKHFAPKLRTPAKRNGTRIPNLNYVSEFFSELNRKVVESLQEELYEKGFINRVSSGTFRKVFSDKVEPRISKKIEWLGYEISFRYFIKLLVDKKVLKKTMTSHWLTANDCFSLLKKPNHDWTKGGSEGVYKNAKESTIDKIIEIALSNAKKVPQKSSSVF